MTQIRQIYAVFILNLICDYMLNLRYQCAIER